MATYKKNNQNPMQATYSYLSNTLQGVRSFGGSCYWGHDFTDMVNRLTYDLGKLYPSEIETLFNVRIGYMMPYGEPHSDVCDCIA